MNISENTVEQHMRKALRLLRISFANYDIFLVLMAVHLHISTIS